MKKSMIAIGAAALCATVFGSIQSANVVGYAGNDEEMNLIGATMMTATFLKVGDTAPTFGNMIPIDVASGEAAAAGMIEIQGLNSDGTTDSSFDYFWMGTSWMNMTTFEDASEETFTQGKGLWVYNNTGARVRFQCSGQVSDLDANYPMNAIGATAIGNCFPVRTTWGEVAPIAPTGVELSGMIEVQGLNSDGTTDSSFDYFWMGTYWMNMSTFENATDEQLPVGKGLWVYNNSGSSGVSLQIAAPAL